MFPVFFMSELGRQDECTQRLKILLEKAQIQVSGALNFFGRFYCFNRFVFPDVQRGCTQFFFQIGFTHVTAETMATQGMLRSPIAG